MCNCSKRLLALSKNQGLVVVGENGLKYALYKMAKGLSIKAIKCSKHDEPLVDSSAIDDGLFAIARESMRVL